jgi:hypothetical protein
VERGGETLGRAGGRGGVRREAMGWRGAGTAGGLPCPRLNLPCPCSIRPTPPAQQQGSSEHLHAQAARTCLLPSCPAPAPMDRFTPPARLQGSTEHAHARAAQTCLLHRQRERACSLHALPLPPLHSPRLLNSKARQSTRTRSQRERACSHHVPAPLCLPPPQATRACLLPTRPALAPSDPPHLLSNKAHQSRHRQRERPRPHKTHPACSTARLIRGRARAGCASGLLLSRACSRMPAPLCLLPPQATRVCLLPSRTTA